MSSFKGDRNYRPYYDELFSYDTSSDEEPHYPTLDPARKRRNWVDFHYNELMELYSNFRESGQRVFGNVFFQTGDFEQFVDFIYENTIIYDADLLKAKRTAQHVGSLGAGTRSKSRLFGLQKTGNQRPPGDGAEGMGGRWCDVVGTSAAGRKS